MSLSIKDIFEKEPDNINNWPTDQIKNNLNQIIKYIKNFNLEEESKEREY